MESLSISIFSELRLATEASSSSTELLGDAGKHESPRINSGSITFVAHPKRHTKEAAAWSCDKSACRVVANSLTVAFSLETTKTAYNNLKDEGPELDSNYIEINTLNKNDVNTGWKSCFTLQ